MTISTPTWEWPEQPSADEYIASQSKAMDFSQRTWSYTPQGIWEVQFAPIYELVPYVCVWSVCVCVYVCVCMLYARVYVCVCASTCLWTNWTMPVASSYISRTHHYDFHCDISKVIWLSKFVNPGKSWLCKSTCNLQLGLRSQILGEYFWMSKIDLT